MNSHRMTGFAAATVAAVFLGLAALPLASSAAAQEAPPRYIEVDPITAEETGAEPWDIAAAMSEAQSQFKLFGFGDRAWTSLRMVGDNVIWETNTGPGDDYGGPIFNLFSPINQYNTVAGTRFQTFGIPLMWGAPRSEWVRYLAEGVGSLQNVQGDPPGWTVLWNGDVFGRPKDLDAADGLVGTLLSGVTSTTDGSCLDHSAAPGGAAMNPGFQLLPGSDCPPTWSFGGTQWVGDRPVSRRSWIRAFNQRGTDFRWNRWEIPSGWKNPSRFLGDNVATYGHFNDYNSAVLPRFGNVVPGGIGDPTREGYPLGLDVRFDAFSFSFPELGNAKFWAGIIVNNSSQLYGVPHDYDSLYIGLGPWPGRSQDGDNYMIPELGAWVSSESNDRFSPECAAVDPIPLIGNTCGGFTRPFNAFEEGAHGIVVLKSPIGDLRNKLFTEPTSPFYLPSHPLAGDTITYNHAINWNFGQWGQVWNQGSDRRRFGVLSSTADNVLDETACLNFFSNVTRWRTFRSNDWPTVARQCDFGGWVPGSWSYVSGRPLGAGMGPDTLFLAGCGPFNNGGCPVAWADSTWQGWSANTAGNLSQLHIGPFRLPAEDTTELIIALYSARDSASFEELTRSIYEFYLALFPVEIEVAIDIKPGSDPNSINPNSKGKIPVAVLSDEEFDAPERLDKSSLRFGPTGDEESLSHCNPSSEDVNGDGRLDQVCHFWTEQAGFAPGDTEGVLTGETVDGEAVIGVDAVSIVPPVATSQVAADETPLSFSLSAIYPNPLVVGSGEPTPGQLAAGGVRFQVTIPETPDPRPVRVTVFDLKGRKVAVVLDQVLPAGRHTLSWDGANDRRELVGTGIYYVVMEGGGQVLKKALTVVRR